MESDDAAIIAEHEAALWAEHERHVASKMKRLRVAKRLLSRHKYKALLDELECVMHSYDFRFVRENMLGRTIRLGRWQRAYRAPTVAMFVRDEQIGEDSHRGQAAFRVSSTHFLAWRYEI